MNVLIWHNPRCSKSRETLALLKHKGIEPEVRLYLEDTPGEAELAETLKLLGLSAYEFLRRGEQAFRDANISKDSPEDQVIAAMTKWPKLIERPVVFANGKARIGRPPEAVLEIL